MSLDACEFTPSEIAALHTYLPAWFAKNRRALPWRGDECEGGKKGQPRTPYGVWVSEVMLQQTRVAAVIGYWNRWMERFPTLSSLALASPDDVNLAWQGLGFYRRAHNLHAGAKDVVERFGGQLPSSVEELISIPGIGPYTAGAIASIAFGQSEALVDGNVVRVLSRLRGLEADAKSPALAKVAWKLARSIVPSFHPGDFNEGLMELGATLCTPQSPQCETCPVQSLCTGFRNGTSALAALQSDQPSPAQGEVGRWVSSKYPSKPALKAKVPRERVCVVVIEHHPTSSPLHTRFLLLRSSSSTQGSGSGGGGGLLLGQWAPLAFPLEGSSSDGDTGAAKRKRDITSGKMDASTLSSVSLSLGQHCVIKTEVSAAGSLSFQPLGAPTSLSHIFSHVIHDLEVHRWALCGTAEEATKNLPSNVEARWEDIEGLVERVGLTSWTAKAFFGALGKDEAFASGFEGVKAWKELQARWKKGGMKSV